MTTDTAPPPDSTTAPRSDRAPGSELAEWLSRAAVLQFASLALQPPSTDVIEEMRNLISALPENAAIEARAILDVPLADWEPEFFSVLGPAGCAICESSYERAAQASRGPMLAQVAGFYEAFGYAPDRLREVPDHAAIELGFLSFLAIKVAFARFESQAEAASVAAQAYSDFHRQHLTEWLPACTDALQETGSKQYSAIAAWVRDALGATGEPG
jgi:nitrate reductase assembly molybdenum cofactor insertion protein NarJ